MREPIRETTDEPLLTLTEVCYLLGKGKTWVYDEVRSGRLPSKKIGGVYRFRRSELQRWIDEQEAR